MEKEMHIKFNKAFVDSIYDKNWRYIVLIEDENNSSHNRIYFFKSKTDFDKCVKDNEWEDGMLAIDKEDKKWGKKGIYDEAAKNSKALYKIMTPDVLS